MTSQSQIEKLLNRYPFNENELEFLLQCHTFVMNEKDETSFLMKLVRESNRFSNFLSDDEVARRIEFVETHILPTDFSKRLKSSMSYDVFVDCANEGEEKMLELFLEGIAECGRRGPREALCVIFNCISNGIDKADPNKLINLCYRLTIATQALSQKNIDESSILTRLGNHHSPSAALEKSLRDVCKSDGFTTKHIFIEWADANVPLLASTLSSFLHTILFRETPFPESRIPFVKPELDHFSDIFQGPDCPLLFSFGCMSPEMGGEWHRLYSSQFDGFSFNRLEWSLLGYMGPTTLIIKAENGASLGAFVSSTWKDASHFYGDSNSFLFQLEPVTKVYRPTGKETNFMYCNTSMAVVDDGLPHGMGFGGNTNGPRLFIPESLETCTAGYLDSTYEQGDLLPIEYLEKFNIQTIEVWGVGGDDTIANALRARAGYRDITDSTPIKARVVADKTFQRSGAMWHAKFSPLFVPPS